MKDDINSRQKRVLAIHDISCVGRCSLTVALPILSAAGFDTAVLPTALLSTHTGGFSGFVYRDLADLIDPISEHWQSLGLRFDAIYSGFLGSAAQIGHIERLFDAFKSDGAANDPGRSAPADGARQAGPRGPDTLVMVDPVMADNGELYSVFTPQMAEGMTGLCAKADIVVPNLTETAFLLGEPYIGDSYIGNSYCGGSYDRPYIEDRLRALCALGAGRAVITGVSFERGSLGAAAYDARTGEVFYAFGERVDGVFHGTGDIFGSALLSALLNGFGFGESLRIAVDYTLECIKATPPWQERRYGVCFERALPKLIGSLRLS